MWWCLFKTRLDMDRPTKQVYQTTYIGGVRWLKFLAQHPFVDSDKWIYFQSWSGDTKGRITRLGKGSWSPSSLKKGRTSSAAHMLWAATLLKRPWAVEEERQLGSDGPKKGRQCCRARNVGQAARYPFMLCISKDILELGKVQTREAIISKCIENPADEERPWKQEDHGEYGWELVVHLFMGTELGYAIWSC